MYKKKEHKNANLFLTNINTYLKNRTVLKASFETQTFLFKSNFRTL